MGKGVHTAPNVRRGSPRPEGAEASGPRITPGVQPFWAAFELAQPDVDHFGEKWRYLSWIGEQWRDWRKAFGLPDSARFPNSGQPPFHHWLMDRWSVPEPWRSGRFGVAA